jgi:hypothetical protein
MLKRVNKQIQIKIFKNFKALPREIQLLEKTHIYNLIKIAVSNDSAFQKHNKKVKFNTAFYSAIFEKSFKQTIFISKWLTNLLRCFNKFKTLN